ncbi:succinylglutamate desuccinylase/aspartoacylase family protein [Thalassolituus oleivorans]|uniref:succinylglutamate desuccinylase/aspartoacylase family protein n=1 Tax=Thalassolituus oleivorans TaxID=187493 RepID=UPI001CE2BEA6|nr:succinylglutamate desuccinylase/aspartoacylase family protein [Thalassolituus oleivorans]MCA6126775.1 succinylglutamate desuccinylase [Thalassolituus oleivorans 4BN06-13]
MPFFCRIVFLWTLFLGVSVNNVYATELADDEDIVISEVDEKSIIAEEPVLDMHALETSVEIQAVALQLLGEEVLPGKFMPLNWSPEQSFQSLNTPVPVLVAHGANRGPVMCLTAAIHGDELNGIEMIRRLIYQLDPEKMNGTVIGIPIVNLDGFRRGSRYLADRRDLNRHFPGSPKGSAADRMAYSLFHNVIRHCEYLVDLHTGSLKRTNLPQIRGDLGSETVFDFSRHFGGITVLHGVGAEGTLRRAAENIGIPAITLEAGGPNQLDKSSVDAGLKALETLLQNLGIQPTLRFWGSPQPVFYQSHWIRADQSGILISSVELGDKVKKGDVLGIVTDPMTNTGTKIIATFNGRILGMAFNQVVQTGFAAYHVGVEKEPEAVKEEVLIEGEKIDKPEALLESKIEQE